MIIQEINLKKRKLLWLFTLFLFPVSSVYASGSDVLITEVHAQSATLDVSGINLCGSDTNVALGINGVLIDNSTLSAPLIILSCDSDAATGFDAMTVTGFSLLETGSHRLIVDNSADHSKKCKSKKHSRKGSGKSNKSCGSDKFEFTYVQEGDSGSGDTETDTGADLDAAILELRLDVNCDINKIISLIPIMPPLQVNPLTCI